MDNSKRGAFIVIEGLDRAGKSTQAATLVKRLEDAGMKVRAMKFPGLVPSCPDSTHLNLTVTT